MAFKIHMCIPCDTIALQKHYYYIPGIRIHMENARTNIKVLEFLPLLKLEPQGALIAHLSAMSTSVISFQGQKLDFRMEPKTTTLHNTCF